MSLGPQRLKNFVLCHHLSRVLNQIGQYVKALGGYRHSFAVAPQEVVRCIQTERLE